MGDSYGCDKSMIDKASFFEVTWWFTISKLVDLFDTVRSLLGYHVIWINTLWD
jgi:hypothetical protein